MKAKHSVLDFFRLFALWLEIKVFLTARKSAKSADNSSVNSVTSVAKNGRNE